MKFFVLRRVTSSGLQSATDNNSCTCTILDYNIFFRSLGRRFIMPISSVQLRMAMGALYWSSRKLATKAEVSADTVLRAHRGEDVRPASWGPIQRALEEAGIEFLPETNSVAFHETTSGVAICADPSMPLGIRRLYPR
jgi:hypothetical protein